MGVNSHCSKHITNAIDQLSQEDKGIINSERQAYWFDRERKVSNRKPISFNIVHTRSRS